MLCYLGNNDKEKIDTCSGHMHLNFPHICKDLKNIVLYIYIYMDVLHTCMCLCITYVPGAQKRVLDTLELML